MSNGILRVSNVKTITKAIKDNVGYQAGKRDSYSKIYQNLLNNQSVKSRDDLCLVSSVGAQESYAIYENSRSLIIEGADTNTVYTISYIGDRKPNVYVFDSNSVCTTIADESNPIEITVPSNGYKIVISYYMDRCNSLSLIKGDANFDGLLKVVKSDVLIDPTTQINVIDVIGIASAGDYVRKIESEQPATGVYKYIADNYMKIGSIDPEEFTSINDTTISANTTYSSSKVDSTYAKKTDVDQTYAKKTDVDQTYAKKTDLHSHSNKSALDKIKDSNGKLNYNNNDYSTSNELTLAISDKVSYAITELTVSDGVLNLTDNGNYYVATMPDATSIELPTVSSYCEIHLIYKSDTDLTISFPDIYWQIFPESYANVIYEYIFTFIPGINEWIGGFITYEKTSSGVSSLNVEGDDLNA